MTEAQIQRYARQILLPELGGAGQERLLASRVAVRAEGAAAEALRTYLAAAGVPVAPAPAPAGEAGRGVDRWALSDSAAAWSPEGGPCPGCLTAALAALPSPPAWAAPATAQAAGALAASQILLQLLGRGPATPSLWRVWPTAAREVPRRRDGCPCG